MTMLKITKTFNYLKTCSFSFYTLITFSDNNQHKESLKQAILEGRKYKNWLEFARCGYKYAQPSPEKNKRLNRYLLIGNAIDAFEDVP